MVSGRRIARETLGSAYIWESERVGKTVIVSTGTGWNRIKVDKI